MSKFAMSRLEITCYKTLSGGGGLFISELKKMMVLGLGLMHAGGIDYFTPSADDLFFQILSLQNLLTAARTCPFLLFPYLQPNDLFDSCSASGKNRLYQILISIYHVNYLPN